MDWSFWFIESTIEMQQPSFDSILNEITKIHHKLEKTSRMSEIEIKEYTRRFTNLYNQKKITKQNIVEIFRTNPNKLIQYQNQERIIEWTIRSLKHIFENIGKNTISDIDNNLDKETYHHALNNNQKEEVIQIAIKTLDDFLH